MYKTNIANMLSRLEYSALWLNSGVLTEAALKNQFEEFDTGEDNNTEHYRYRTFQEYLKSKTSLSEIQLINILELISHDPDRSMANSAGISLLNLKILTEQQFDIVASFLASFENRLVKYIEKARAQRNR